MASRAVLLDCGQAAGVPAARNLVVDRQPDPSVERRVLELVGRERVRGLRGPGAQIRDSSQRVSTAAGVPNWRLGPHTQLLI